MIRWIPYAFVRIALFFMLGICLGIYCPDIITLNSGYIIFSGLLLVYGVIIFCFWTKRLLSPHTLKIVAGFVGLLSIFVAGYLNVMTKKESHHPDHLLYISSPVDFFKVVVASLPQEKDNSWKMEAHIQAVKSHGKWKKAEAKILIYAAKSPSTVFKYGDVLLIQGNPQAIPGPGNPEEFDYRRFLSFKNIYHQHFVKPEQVRYIEHDPPSWLTYYALRCRQWADNTLRKNIAGEREQALASALVLGVTDGLDNELLSAYKATGAMHVLAVSGLHVGIVYGLLLVILKPLNRMKFGPWLLAAISVIVLWGYAFVTGLSPSVLRAVAMFSFVALAKPASLRTNMYNSLAASAFFILMYDPFLLMSVGFQLSYLAVLGIVYLQRPLYNLYEPNHRLLDEIWKISSVSIAAQIATFALGLLYFHQFPNYFLLSNLFVIPGSFVVLILGLLILVTNIVQPIALALGVVLEWIIKVLNYIVFALEDLPFSLIENVYINSFQCWLLFALIVCIVMLLQTRTFKWITITFALVVTVSAVQWSHWLTDVNHEKVTVYNVPRHSAFDFNDRGKVYFVSDSALAKDQRKISFHILPSRIKAGVYEISQSAPDFQQTVSGCSLIVWKGRSFLWVFDPAFSIPNGLAFDTVIISNDAVKSISELTKSHHIKQLVIDSSNSSNRVKQLMRQAVSAGCVVHSVLHQGAFELYL
jgi:competence protein ComEC